jgi:hypothetical protein
MDKPFKPNDVAVILRPITNKDEKWDGNFELMVCAVGPVTLPEEDMQDMLAVATLMATTVPMMEDDKAFAEKIMIKCDELYAGGNIDLGVVTAVDETHVLTQYSKTVGGVQ